MLAFLILFGCGFGYRRAFYLLLRHP